MTQPILNWTIEKTAYSYVYNHGLPFGRQLGDSIKQTSERIDSKKASMIIIDGGVGEGKTTLAGEIADIYNNIRGLPPLDFSTDCPQLALGSLDFIKKIRICYEEKLPVIIYDEAGDFSKRASLSKINMILNRTFETYRAFKILVIICLPSFDILDEQLFLNKIPRFLVHVSERGERSGNYAVYSLSKMLWLKYYMKKFPVIKAKCYSMVTPNYRGNFTNLSEKREKDLDKMSTKNKLEVLRGSEIKAEGLVSYRDIAQKLNTSVIGIRTLILKLKIKHVREIKRVKYFNSEIIDQLADYKQEHPPGKRAKL